MMKRAHRSIPQYRVEQAWYCEAAEVNDVQELMGK